MAIIPMRRGGGSPRNNLTRPNGSQFRPAGQSTKRFAPPKRETTPTVTGTDRFAVHAYGNTKINLNGQDVSVLTGYDPDYNLTAFSSYQLAQWGIYVNVVWDDFEFAGDMVQSGSYQYISDYYEEGYDNEDAVRGIPLEIYNINTTGSAVSLKLTALSNEEPEPGPQLMSLTAGIPDVEPVEDVPLGLTAHREFWDRNPEMLTSDQYVNLSAPTSVSVNMIPKVARKYSRIEYLPAIVKPPVWVSLSESTFHTLGIVVSFNGGTPMLFKQAVLSDRESVIAIDNQGSYWREGIIQIEQYISLRFRDDVVNFLYANETIRNAHGLHPSSYYDDGYPTYLDGDSRITPSLFRGTNGDSYMFSFELGDIYAADSMTANALRISGVNEIYDLESDGNPEYWGMSLDKPCYITIHPNHSLILNDPEVTVDLGLESTYSQNQVVKPFNVWSTGLYYAEMAAT